MINDRYILKDKLGEGRSNVYLCADADLSMKEFAIKILPDNRDSHEKKLFKDEFFSLKKLNYPSIVKPYDLGNVTKADEAAENKFLGCSYFTLEYFPGAELLKFQGIKDPGFLKEIIIQICSVLYYLHQSNYIFYDLKPENILAAQLNGNPSIKLIDLGLAAHLSSGPIKNIRGTAEYIAPEILKEEPHDHRADLYSLGILIYRIIYGRFPFSTDNKVDVYKAQIEKEFEFHPSDYPGYFTMIMRKLLDKDPEKRYPNSLSVIKDLNSGIENLSSRFAPAKIFTGRRDIINILSSFIDDKESTELFVIKGSEDSGKTTLLNQIYSLNEKVIPVFNNNRKSGFDFIKLFLKDIVFSEYVYPQLSEELKARIYDFIHGSVAGIIEEVKSIISQISLSSNFILVIDDINKLDRFSWELFMEIIPILQVNYIKVIVAEDSEAFSKLLHNTKELMLNPFTEVQVNEFVEKSFAGFFPRTQLEKIILIYSDLLPGSITRFIDDLLLLKIIKYENGIPDIGQDETPLIETILKSSQQEIYNIRMNSLAGIENEAAKYISAFEAPAETYILSALLNIGQKEVIEILGNLSNKNIIHLNQQSSIPVITSEGFKKYIYSTIYEKKEFHSRIAELLEKVDGINRSETARHYELAENYSKCLSILNDEAENARNMSAFSYQKKIYHHLLKLPLDEKNYAEIKYNLAQVHYKLSEFQNCLGLVTELLQIGVIDGKKNELLILKGSCLVELGKYQEGKEILNNLLPKTEDSAQKLKLLTEIANAEYELGRYKEVKKIYNAVILDADLPLEEKGKCYNLMGLTEIFNENKLDEALIYFKNASEVYSKANLKSDIANMQQNIGNIYNIKGDAQNAKTYWDNSLDTNRLIGNIIREAQLLHNYGIYYFDNLNFDQSINNYLKALSIYKAIGNKYFQALILYNVGELFLLSSEYQKACDSLNDAYEQFINMNKLQNALNSLFLLGRLYYVIGDYDGLKKIIDKYNLETGKDIQEKQITNFKVLLYMHQLISNPSLEILDKLINLHQEYLSINEPFEYANLNLIISSILIDMNEFEKAAEQLENRDFKEICKKKYLFESENEYLLGKISEVKSLHNLEPSIKCYESAYNKIKDAQVTELTWKLMFSLGLHYAKRGNRNKAKDYFYYSKSIIIKIADSFVNQKLKEAYLKKPERESALEIMLNESS